MREASRSPSGVTVWRTSIGKPISGQATSLLISKSFPSHCSEFVPKRDGVYSKMDSFIRSKYESKRWAREGPVPSDPSVLDTGSSALAAQPEPVAAPPPVSAPPRGHAPTSSVSSARATPVTNRQPQPHQLLSTSMTNRPTAQPAAPQPTQAPQQQPVAAQPAQATAANDLFSLDFHNPTPPAPQAQAPKKDVKQDILSLFSTPAPQAAPAYGVAQNQFAAQQPAFGQQPQNVWGAPVAAQPQQQHQQPTSMVGQNGVGMWGVSSGWNQAPAAPAQSNLWGQPAAAPAPAPGLGGYGQPQAAPQQPSLFDTNDIWGSSNAGATGGANLFGGSTTATQQKKDDVFGDIWGGFK